ncbi:DUF308 domain-containing protein [Candidatus Methanosphaera massiliense]|uniref:DUF308 domain-containing protein n=1 Tax=Methanosphaera TaxID=2316 RepID=UPI002380634D|nr:DUF308 domain-containing protein [Candidatus Methanosphaera massiliense]MDD6285531.1 DUF308 domain-containing protein [Methanobacteriaceae archaeon]MDE4078585.1 DUF308 domain-containing protein [Candidatus Methanosphaera massiliense]MDY2744037.1 DUF308 domain-containing protein [Methanosphaera sp.]
MDIGNWEINTPAIIMILLGILALIFPAASTQTIGIIVGILFLLIAIVLIIAGFAEIAVSRAFAGFTLIIAILCILLSYFLMFNPASVAILVSVIIYLLGIIMIIVGIFNLVTGQLFKPLSAMGITGLIFGILFIVIGVFVRNPTVLGIIVGLWLIISGILSIYGDNDKNYIDI